MVTSWLQNDNVNIYPTTNTGKYTVFKTGELYVFNVDHEDGYKSYSCRTVNKLTGKIQSSYYPAHLIVTEINENVQPRISVQRHSTKYSKIGEDVIFSCIAQGFPTPDYKWFKNEKEQFLPLIFNERINELAPGLLLISKIKLDDKGKYVCMANNSAGKDSVQINLVVTAPLSVHIQPQIQIVDVNNEAVFECVIGGFPLSQISWFHDGKLLTKSKRHKFKENFDKLYIKPVEKQDRGMYQCFVSNEWEMVQSAAEIQLGDTSPELISWFSEKTLQPGSSISLKCSATGSPPPHFSWSLDGFPVPDSSRFIVGQYITTSDNVITHLNITRTEEEDGGEYKCTAKNSVSEISHAAKINIYGKPFIRSMPKINAIAGKNFIIKCPVAGYPIESISWEQGGVYLPINRRQKVYSNGTLIIENLQKEFDGGTYTCQAKNNQRATARRNVEIHIMVPPKILLTQDITLREGMRAAITCQIIEGDLPFKFRWEKNGLLIADEKLQIRRVDEYSSLIVIDNISTDNAGNYTCFAQNVAGEESLTVSLTVKVPPKWKIEPVDTNVTSGQELILNCQGNGYPTPTTTWKKSTGEFLGEYKDFLYDSNISIYPNGSLKFSKIFKENQGHYLCELKNEVGSGLSKLIYLKVNVPVYFPQKFKQIQVIQGKEAHMQCPAIGETPIEIEWRIKGQKIQENKHSRYIINKQILTDGLVSEISIPKTYRHDTGIFTCYATNSFGRDEMKIQLIVQENPEIPKNIRINDKQSRSLQISWTQPYAGNSQITNYIIEYKKSNENWEKNSNNIIVTGSETFTTLKNLKPFTSYHVRVIAENPLGKSEPSEFIQVITQEEVPDGPPLNVKGNAESSTEIKVSWDSPPKNTWNGNLLGYYVGYKENLLYHVTTSILNSSSKYINNYNFKTVDKISEFEEEIILEKLNKYTTYSIIVQAFNSKGSGPASEPILIRTKEDVPSSSPENIICKTLSSQSIEISWDPPNSNKQNGILLGYKIFYKVVSNKRLLEEDEEEIKITKLTKTVISGLSKYSNHSFTLLAFTSAGDGIKSDKIFCKTDEDVPSSPKDIKAALSSFDNILVTWLPPLYKNGIIISYTIYMTLINNNNNNNKEEKIRKEILNPGIEIYETVRNQKKGIYKFWVTASTKIGESQRSTTVTIYPSNEIPAKIMSFNKNVITPWKEKLNLTCLNVGIPNPNLIWKFKSTQIKNTNSRIQVQNDGSLIIKDVQKMDEGNYSCSVENVYGKDEIIYNLIIEVPPERPKLSVVSSTSDSLQLEWKIITDKNKDGDDDDVNNILGYRDFQISVPVLGKNKKILIINSSSVGIKIDSWQDGGCPIRNIFLEYQRFDEITWTKISRIIQSNDSVIILTDLEPATKYNVKITAQNNAGSSTIIYNFTTLTVTGEKISSTDENELNQSDNNVPFYHDFKIIILLFISLIIFIILLTAIFIIRKKKTTTISSPHIVDNENNFEHEYSAIKIYNKSEIIKKGKGGGEQREQQDEQQPEQQDYLNDPYPFSAFKISRSPYSESSL
ncbi:down syndrome cell adhesion molecule, putative, partial [Pediculus humanus corporis]